MLHPIRSRGCLLRSLDGRSHHSLGYPPGILAAISASPYTARTRLPPPSGKLLVWMPTTFSLLLLIHVDWSNIFSPTVF